MFYQLLPYNFQFSKFNFFFQSNYYEFQERFINQENVNILDVSNCQIYYDVSICYNDK